MNGIESAERGLSEERLSGSEGVYLEIWDLEVFGREQLVLRSLSRRRLHVFHVQEGQCG